MVCLINSVQFSDNEQHAKYLQEKLELVFSAVEDEYEVSAIYCMKNIKTLQIFHFFGHFLLKHLYLKIMSDFIFWKTGRDRRLKFGMDALWYMF